MSENYFQHADHFSRVLSEQENLKKSKFAEKASVEKSQELTELKDKKSVSEESNAKSEKIQSEAN